MNEALLGEEKRSEDIFGEMVDYIAPSSAGRWRTSSRGG